MIDFVIFAAVVICFMMSVPLAIGLMKRINRQDERRSLPAADIIARLERMEQGMEAIGTEVERVSEGQRFTTRLLNADIQTADPKLR